MAHPPAPFEGVFALTVLTLVFAAAWGLLSFLLSGVL